MKQPISSVILLVLSFATASAQADVEAYTQQKVTEVIQKYGAYIIDALYEFNFPVGPSHVVKQIMQESSGKPCKKSKSGAIGLMQLKRDMAFAEVKKHFPNHDFGDALCDPKNNIRAGIAYRVYIADIYKGGGVYSEPAEVDLAYYWGPAGAQKRLANVHRDKYVRDVASWGKYVPPVSEW